MNKLLLVIYILGAGMVLSDLITAYNCDTYYKTSLILFGEYECNKVNKGGK